MVSQLPDRMTGIRGLPHGLRGRDALKGFDSWYKPILLIPGGPELFQQDRPERGRRSRLSMSIKDSAEGKQNGQKEVFFHKKVFKFSPPFPPA
jgi:hypothetical protein